MIPIWVWQRADWSEEKIAHYPGHGVMVTQASAALARIGDGKDSIDG